MILFICREVCAQIGLKKETLAHVALYLKWRIQNDFSIKADLISSLQDNHSYLGKRESLIFGAKIQKVLDALQSELSLSTDLIERAKSVIMLLWKYDLRRSANNGKYYPNIAKNICRSLKNNEPITFVQFTCITRNKKWLDGLEKDKPEEFIAVDAQNSNLIKELPYLQKIKKSLTELWVDSKIVVVFWDSGSYWVDMREWESVNMNSQQLLSKIRNHWKEAYNNMVQHLNMVAPNTITLVSAYEWEQELKNKELMNFEEEFAHAKETVYQDPRFSLSLVAFAALKKNF